MKKIKSLIVAVLAMASSSAYSQGAMIVEDPTQILQNATNHAESFGEMMTQTSVFLEDLDMQYDEWSKNVEEYANKVKLATAAGKKIMVLYKEIDNVYTELEYFRKSLKKTNYLNASEKLVLYAEGVAAVRSIMKNKEDILTQAKTNANVTAKSDGYKNLESLNKMINLVRQVDKKLGMAISHANNLIRAKKRLVERTQQMNRLFGIQY